MEPSDTRAGAAPRFDFSSKELIATLPDGSALSLPLLPMRLIFRERAFDEFTITSESGSDSRREIGGHVVGTAISFLARWSIDPEGWARFDIRLDGRPDAAWGEFHRLVLLDHETGREGLISHLGWRELGQTSEAALTDRPPEEGGGLLPPFGYPIFGPGFFLGAEHPMACIEAEGSRARVFHHPLWKGESLTSIPLVLGLTREGESVEHAFARYMATMRRPQPERAIVEVNTFWTDGFEIATKYRHQTDPASYLAMAKQWARNVMGGERGLISHFLLDAGWQDDASLYRPQDANGGPGDDTLGEIGRAIEAEGFQFGLWFSVNGPIGTDPQWAAAQGYRTHDQGTGAGYSANNGKIRYICLTDQRWEEDLSRRMEELIVNTPVTFFKGDWDNDAIDDPHRHPGDIPSQAHLREAIADAMIRIYGRMHGANPAVALRGAWWLSPWWCSHVDNTHLPNSGDMESCDVPSLTQRDSGLTCRDAMYHHIMVRHATPIPWDVLCPHEFASSRRNPVQDSIDSWLNNLAVWASRGTHYLQLYLSPYGLESWKAWSLREILRWFRSDEELHWKSGTRMLGGDPIAGQIYAYLHESSERTLLTIRNPLAHPQALGPLSEWELEDGGWTQVYPFCRAFPSMGYVMASHEVIILTRDTATAGEHVNTHTGWQVPVSPEPPLRHELPATAARLHFLDSHKLVVHATLPYGLASAELVLAIRSEGSDRDWRAGLGRYEEDVATFNVPITHVRPHWQGGYAQGRLRATPQDPSLSILRIPIGTGGDAHAFLRSEQPLPEILGAWIEGKNILVPTQDGPQGLYPPAPDAPLRHIITVDIVRS